MVWVRDRGGADDEDMFCGAAADAGCVLGIRRYPPVPGLKMKKFKKQ